MKKHLNPMLSIGMIGLFIFGTYLAIDLYDVFYGNKDIWWTPKQMMLPLDETKGYFEIRINDQSLVSLIDKGAVYVTDKAGNQYRVAAKDAGVRLNNWESRQLKLLKFSIVYALISGACLTLFVAGIVQIFRE